MVRYYSYITEKGICVSMINIGKSDYVRICIYYHVLSVVLASGVYFFYAIRAGDFNFMKVLVASGMMAACFISAFLYKRILDQDINTIWLYVVVIAEVFSYGIFIFFTGGYYSPFLWYCVSCLFLPMSINMGKGFMFFAAGWYLLCTVINRMMPGMHGAAINLEVNTGIGVVFVIAGFYILASYIQKLNEYQLSTEQALNHITDLYDSFHLFTMSDIDKIMEQLMEIIHRTIAPQGGVLIKFNEDGKPGWRHAVGMDETAFGDGQEWEDYRESYEEGCDVLYIGYEPDYSGVLLRPRSEEHSVESSLDDFHYHLIDIVFKNIDVQKQLEEYIVEEEQKRIADEIHDTVIQKLFGIACKLKLLESALPEVQPKELSRELIALKESAELTMKELREAIYGNRFSEHEKKFVEKLDAYMEGVKRLWDIDIITHVDRDADSLSVSQKLAIYKTVCEAVNNAVRHGEADAVTVDIVIEGKGINTVISDNGKGIGPVAGREKNQEGNGIKNMQRLAKAFKGKCLIETLPEKGTKVILYLPR